MRSVGDELTLGFEGGIEPCEQLVEGVAELLELIRRAADSRQLLVDSGIALGIVALLALVAGWLIAGRMLRPIRTITRTAQRISSASLHERLALDGPPPGELIPAFERLTLLQQRELGRQVAPGAKLNVVLPSCTRRGSSPRGPGDWVCTINVPIPTATGSLPPQPTPVTYDVSVASDGCYKAESPPAFVGQQLMRDAAGQQVVNPLYTIYGCFDVL